MILKLTPVLCDTRLTLRREGEVLHLNGHPLDLSGIPEGATLPQDAITGPGAEWLGSGVERVGGALHLTLILPHGARAPVAALFPAPVVDPPDGPVALPDYEIEEPADED